MRFPAVRSHRTERPARNVEHVSSPIQVIYRGSDSGHRALASLIGEAGGQLQLEAHPVAHGDRFTPRTWHGQVTGVDAETATATARAFLASTNGHRVLLDGTEVFASAP